MGTDLRQSLGKADAVSHDSGPSLWARSADKTHRHVREARPDVHQQPIAGVSPESSRSKVWDVAGGTSLAGLPSGSAVGVKEDSRTLNPKMMFKMHIPRALLAHNITKPLYHPSENDDSYKLFVLSHFTP